MGRRPRRWVFWHIETKGAARSSNTDGRRPKRDRSGRKDGQLGPQMMIINGP